MNCPTAEKRSFETVKLLNYGFAQFELLEYRSKYYEVDEYRNVMLSPNKFKIVTNEPIYFVVKKGESLENLVERYEYNIDRKTLRVGDEIGQLEIMRGNEVIYTVPLTVSEDIHRANFFAILGRMFKLLFFGG